MTHDDFIECTIVMPNERVDLTRFLRDLRWRPNGNLVLEFAANPVSLVLNGLNRQDARQRKLKNDFTKPETWMSLTVETRTQRRVYHRAVVFEILTFWKPDSHIVAEFIPQAG